MKKAFLLVAIAATLSGCASTAANLQRETARSIGDVSPDAVTVRNIDRGVTSVNWDADSPKGAYSCGADDMVRRVNCVKK